MKNSKEKILTAASELFLQGGVNALSVRAIAKHAGLSTIGIYSHFQGKQGILDSIYIEGFERVYTAIDVSVDDTDAKSAAMLALSNYMDFAADYEAHYRLIFGENNGNYQPSDNALLVGAKAFARLTKLVSELMPNVTEMTQKQQNALQVWALAHGYVSLNHHVINQMLESKQWRRQALAAVEIHIDAMLQQYNKLYQ